MSPLFNCVRVCTYSTRIVRESSRVRVGACRGPGGSWEVSMVTCELLEQPIEVHALSTRTWVEYTPSPETNTHRQWRSRKACTTQKKPWITLRSSHLQQVRPLNLSVCLLKYSSALCPFSSVSVYFFPFLSLPQKCSPSVSQLHSHPWKHDLSLHILYNYCIHNPSNHCEYQTLCY